MGVLPPAAARGHQLPLLELKAVQPAPTRPSTDSTPPRSQPGSSPAANTASERKTFKEHLPCPCQGRRGAGTWAQAPSLCFQEAFFFFLGSIPGYCQRSSLCSQLPSQWHFPRKHLPYSSFSVLESSTGQAVPHQTTSIQNAKHILFKLSRVESSH